jgi:2-oxoglutarate dehydrogenase complex dehydrogenase (E1) component-like enzyme
MFTKYDKLDAIKLKYVGRSENASPATGFSKTHAEQQQALIDKLVQPQLVK